jgi:fatty-acyl-CoA synthase
MALPISPAPTTLPALLRQWTGPERCAAPALSFGAQRTRYGELAHQAHAAAAQLWHGWGVRPGDRVAWLGHNHPGQLVLLFALARIGAVLLPLNFRLAAAEWDAQLRDCTPTHLVHDDALSPDAQALALRHSVPAHPVHGFDAAGTWPDAPLHADPESPALLVYTSGTTGRPRAAVHRQRHLLANMRLAAEVQRIVPGDVVLTVLPMFHVGGLCIQTLPALWAGAHVLLHARFDAGATLAALAAHRPTLTLQVPATMRALVEHGAWPTTDLHCLRAVWAGSSLLPDALVAAFHARGVPVCNVYGATETGPFSIALPGEHAMNHVGSCGWPAPGVEVQLQGVAGELWLRGPNVVSHYWPDLAAVDAQGWFHTGDLAEAAADGSWRIVGRAKDLIISGGENIHPAEIESALADVPGLDECAAFGVPDAAWGEAVALAYVARDGCEVGEDDLRRHLGTRLARYKWPRHWLRLEALPKTALGKVQRHALAERFPPR